MKMTLLCIYPLASYAIGAGVTIAGALFFARPVRKFLTALAEACDTFRESWRDQGKKKPAAARAQKPADSQLDPIQRDVVSALVNLGTSERKATAHVLALGTAENFETLFRRASSSFQPAKVTA